MQSITLHHDIVDCEPLLPQHDPETRSFLWRLLFSIWTPVALIVIGIFAAIVGKLDSFGLEALAMAFLFWWLYRDDILRAEAYKRIETADPEERQQRDEALRSEIAKWLCRK